MKKRIIITVSIIVIALIAIFTTKHMDNKKISSYNSRHEDYALQFFYDKDSFTGELSISDPVKIAKIKEWDKNGIGYIYSYVDKEISPNIEIMDFLHSEVNADEWRNSVIDALYVMLAEDAFTDSKEPAGLSYDSKLQKIEQKRAYKEKAINDAMEVFILGADNAGDSNQYNSIMDIPMDLQNACLYAIDESPITGYELPIAWSIAISSN